MSYQSVPHPARISQAQHRDNLAGCLGLDGFDEDSFSEDLRFVPSTLKGKESQVETVYGSHFHCLQPDMGRLGVDPVGVKYCEKTENSRPAKVFYSVSDGSLRAVREQMRNSKPQPKAKKRRSLLPCAPRLHCSLAAAMPAPQMIMFFRTSPHDSRKRAPLPFRRGGDVLEQAPLFLSPAINKAESGVSILPDRAGASGRVPSRSVGESLRQAPVEMGSCLEIN